MDHDSDERDSLAGFRAAKRRLILMSAAEGAATRDALVVVAAWLEEANDRIPRLLAGAPSVTYDAAAFAADALRHAGDVDPAVVAGRLRRAADRFEIMVAELSPADLAEEPDARELIERIVQMMTEGRAAAGGRGEATDARLTGDPA